MVADPKSVVFGRKGESAGELPFEYRLMLRLVSVALSDSRVSFNRPRFAVDERTGN
jgi:hypothetical protein